MCLFACFYPNPSFEREPMNLPNMVYIVMYTALEHTTLLHFCWYIVLYIALCMGKIHQWKSTSHISGVGSNINIKLKLYTIYTVGRIFKST